jgi:hypothetical protein
MDELIDMALKYEKIIFHCQFCQHRGPKSASYFLRFFQKRLLPDKSLEILILRGGFDAWYFIYGDDPLLCPKIEAKLP